MDSRPIGVFDSGVGGLSVVQALRAYLPSENIIYYADTANVPYGDKSQEFIEQRCLALAELLIAEDVKAIVIACNTATVSSITALRNNYGLPIIGVEPGIKPALKSSKTGVVGVLATTQTLRSNSFNRLAEGLGDNTKILLQACPGLMEKVERLEFNDAITEQLINQYMQPLVLAGADHIVLGCTHYAFLLPLIRLVAGPNITLVNTASAVAKEVVRRLTTADLLAPDKTVGAIELLTSGDKKMLDKQVEVLMKLELVSAGVADEHS
jgi:glutamate racemase